MKSKAAMDRREAMPPAGDPHDLQRFVDAQDPLFEEVRGELRVGKKQGCWMWFIFPQLKGLGHSGTSDMFGISSLQEAEAYLQHPVLGPRLRECTQLVNAVAGRSTKEIFGWTDTLKFRSSMTLFARATTDNQIFKDALEKYYAGEPDKGTLALLNAGDDGR